MKKIVDRTWAIMPGEMQRTLRTPSVAGRANLVFADSPYNFGIKYGESPASADRLPKHEFRSLVETWIESMFIASAPGGVVAFLISEDWADFVGTTMTRFGPRLNRVIWFESFANYNSSERAMSKAHRHLFIHQNPGGVSTFNADDVRISSVRQNSNDNRARNIGKVPGDVWFCPRLPGNSVHRVPWHDAQLHPAPLTRMIRMYTHPHDLVVDGFAGSGSLGVCCAREGRRFIGAEREPVYVKNLRARLKTAFAAPGELPPVEMFDETKEGLGT